MKKRKIRQYLASALMVTMVGSMGAMPAMADETSAVTVGWRLADDGYWYFYNSKGVMRKNEERVVHKQWYAFDEEGRMFCDQLFDSPEIDPYEVGGGSSGGQAVFRRYAYPDGHLAQKGEWLLLNEDGSRHKHTDDCTADQCQSYWYYFKKDDITEENTDASYQKGLMAAGEELKVEREGKYYRFDEEGHMYSQEIVQNQEDNGRFYPDATASYYKYNGEKAIDQWLPVNDYWYHFDENGNIDNLAGVATDSDADRVNDLAKEAHLQGTSIDAPYLMVEDIEIVGNKEKQVTIGKPIELKFQAKLASDSNADHQGFKKSVHDIHLPKSMRGVGGKGVKISAAENGLCTVTYTTYSNQEEELSLIIDDVISESYTLIPKATESKEESAAAAGAILDAWKDGSLDAGGSATEVKDSLAALYDKDDAEVKDALKETLLANSDSLKELESAYAFENGISNNQEISADALSLLPNGAAEKITIIGGSLNAEAENSKVTLKIGKDDSGAAGQLAGQYEKAVDMVAFNITFAIDDEEQSKLLLPVIITMPLPSGFEAGAVELYRIHEGEDPEQLEMNITDGKATFVTDRFSAYVFVANTEKKPSRPSTGGSSSSGGGSSTRESIYNSLPSGYQGETKIIGNVRLPLYTVEGTWTQTETGWSFADQTGNVYRDTWGAIYNPYANVAGGQSAFDWFRFDANGNLMTGWYTDPDGLSYYLNPNSDGRLGAMATGWTVIDGKNYYFNEQSDGSRGSLLKNAYTPDGYFVDQNGVWVQ